MRVTAEQLDEASKTLTERREAYARAKVPIIFSPKVLLLHLKGPEAGLRRAWEDIGQKGFEVCREAPLPNPPFPEGREGLHIVLPLLHFDFEDAESNLMGLLTQAIAIRERVRFVGRELIDTFANIDTVRPLDIPVNWTTCTIEGIPIARVELNPSEKPGFSVQASRGGTTITNLKSLDLDSRLVRVKLYHLLRSMIESTKPYRRNLVDIRCQSDALQ